MGRPLIVIGNWKMHKTVDETLAFVNKLPKEILGHKDVLLALPFTSLYAAHKAVGSSLCIGAQNVSEHKEGAYTGEISVKMIRGAGASFSLVGHSERRTHYHDTNGIVALKVKALLQEGLTPVICIGETEGERMSHKTEAVLHSQLSAAIEGLTEQDVAKVMVAYEPVWAIGTGRAATAEMAQHAHRACREVLRKKYCEELAQKIPILYGGSVNPSTIRELIQMPDVDGALVGGASLEVDSFVKIVTIAREYKS